MSQSLSSSKQESLRPRRKISWRRKLLYSCVCIGLFLVVCEIGLRVRHWVKYGSASQSSIGNSSWIYDEELGMRRCNPGWEVQSQLVSIKVNSLGYRGEEITLEKPPNTIRIVCLGSSTTFCYEVSDNQTWCHRLQGILQEKHPDVRIQVINAGVGGNVASDAFKYLPRILTLKPDCAILLEGSNDLAYDTRMLARNRGLIGPNDSYESPTAHFLSDNCMLFNYAHKNARILWARWESPEGKLKELPEDLPARFVGEVDKIHGALKQHDIPLVLSTFLTKARKSQEPSERLRNADGFSFYMPWLTSDIFLDGIELSNQALVEYGRSNNLTVVEDVESVPGDSRHFADAVHFTAEGCERMAQRIAKVLEEKGVIQAIVAKRKQGNPN